MSVQQSNFPAGIYYSSDDDSAAWFRSYGNGKYCAYRDKNDAISDINYNGVQLLKKLDKPIEGTLQGYCKVRVRNLEPDSRYSLSQKIVYSIFLIFCIFVIISLIYYLSTIKKT